MDSISSWVSGDYTLTKTTLSKEQQNKIYHISGIGLDRVRLLSELPICETRELNNDSEALHMVIETGLQKFFQKYHRYGPNPKTSENDCPYQAGDIKKQFDTLIGEHNLGSLYEGESEVYRNVVLLYFTKPKLDSLNIIYKNLTTVWLSKQMQVPQVLLFDSILHLVGECLIKGLLGFRKSGKEDVDFNVEYWKSLFAPGCNDLKVEEELKNESFIKSFYDRCKDGIQSAKKIHSVLISSKFQEFAEKIYENTVFEEGTLANFMNQRNFPLEEIVECIKGMLLAGQETVAYFLSFILFEYAKNPALQKTHGSDFNGINKMFLETLRLYSVAGSKRQVACDMVLEYPDASGEFKLHYLRQGDIIGCNHYLTGHNKEKWENAENFNPERENLKLVNETPHFGSGAHRCIGEKAAKEEIFTIITEVFTQAVISTHVPQVDVVDACFTLRPRTDVYVTFSKKPTF